jgi:hypothetical protein
MWFWRFSTWPPYVEYLKTNADLGSYGNPAVGDRPCKGHG